MIFDHRALLEHMRAIAAHEDTHLSVTIDEVVERLRRDVRRHRDVWPFRVFRGQPPLDQTRLIEELRSYHSLGPLGLGSAMFTELLRDARPFVYPLTRRFDGTRHLDGVALAGAFYRADQPDSRCVLLVRLRVDHENPCDLVEVVPDDWHGDWSTVRLQLLLENLYVECDETFRVGHANRGTDRQALLYLPNDAEKKLLPGTVTRMQAIFAGQSVLLHVTSDRSHCLDLIRRNEGVRLLLTWSRFSSHRGVGEVDQFFQVHAHRPALRLSLNAVESQLAIEELRAGLPATMAGWTVPPHRGIKHSDGWYYLRKRDSGGGRDDFSPSPKPCKHNAWIKLYPHNAPQAWKGAHDFFHRDPDLLQKCRPGCHVYRAWFDGE